MSGVATGQKGEFLPVMSTIPSGGVAVHVPVWGAWSVAFKRAAPFARLITPHCARVAADL